MPQPQTRRNIVASKQFAWIILTGILLLAFALRLYGLAGQDLWGDEAFSVGVIQKPFVEIIGPGIETHPPLYHILLFSWANLTAAPTGHADPFLWRFGSLILGLLVIPVTYALTRRITKQKVALLVALLAAIAPMQIYYSQEVRMYSLLVLVSALNVWAFLVLTKKPGRGVWAFYLGATLAAMYAHYNVFWIIAAQNVVALFTNAWRGRRRDWIAGQVVLALIYLPWVLAQADFLLARGGQKGAFALSIDQIVSIIGQSLRSWVVGVTGSGGTVTLLALIAALICAGVGLLAFWRKSRWQTVLLGCWIAFTLIMVVLMDPVMPFAFNERFAIAGMTAFLVLVAQGAIWLAGRQRFIGAILLALVFWGGLSANVNWYADPNPNRAIVASHDWTTATPSNEKDSYADAMRSVLAESTEGDLILLSNEQQGALRDYYAPSPNEILDSVEVNSPRTDGYLANLVGDTQRIWLVEFGDPAGYDAMRLVPAWLAENGFRQRFFSYYGGTVSLYVLGEDDGPLQALDVQFGDSIRLSGYRLTPQDVLPGEELRLALQWEAIIQPAARYTVGNYVLSGDMQLVAQTDAEPRGGTMSTDTWEAGAIVEDRYAIPLPADLPPGTYHLAVGLYAWPDSTRIAVQGGDHLDNALLLTTFNVVGAE